MNKFIKFNSHRAREYGLALIGKRPSFFSFDRDTGRGAFQVSEKEIAQLKDSPRAHYFSVMREPYNDLAKCWTV